MRKGTITSPLNLEFALKIIALKKIIVEEDCDVPDECMNCKAQRAKAEEWEGLFETPWHELVQQANGYFMGYKDGCNFIRGIKK